VRQAGLFLLLDDLRRGAGDEALVGELGVGLDDLAFEAGDFLGSGARVSAATSISILSIRRVSPTTAIGALASSGRASTICMSESLASALR
jgi:hypothetical protein